MLSLNKKPSEVLKVQQLYFVELNWNSTALLQCIIPKHEYTVHLYNLNVHQIKGGTTTSYIITSFQCKANMHKTSF